MDIFDMIALKNRAQLGDIPNQYRSKTVKLEQTDLSETLQSQIAGTAGLLSIPQDDSVTTLKVADKAILPAKIEGSNIVDLLTENIVTGKFVRYTGGTVSSPEYYTDANYNCSGAIDLSGYLEGETLTFKTAFNLNSLNSTCSSAFFAYNSSGTSVLSAAASNVTTGQYSAYGITYDSSNSTATINLKTFCEHYNARYIIINYQTSWSDMFINKVLNSKTLDWLIVNDNQLSANINLTKDITNFIPTINLPDTIVCMVGKEYNIYNNGIYVDNRMSQNYLYMWSYNSGNLGMIEFDGGVKLTPTVPGDYILTLTIHRQTSTWYTSLYTKTLNVKVIANTEITTNYKLMFIGDSRTNDNTMVSTVKTDIPILTMLGTVGSIADAKHEGRSGWLAQDYCQTTSKYSYSNPFYNASNPVSIPTITNSNGALTSYFDMSYYCANNSIVVGGIDAINILLGVNDNYTYEAIRYLIAMVNSIHAFDANIKIFVMHEYVSPNSNYPTPCLYRRSLQYRFFTLLTTYFGGRESEKIYLLPTNTVINKTDFNYSNVAISARDTTTESRCSDATHVKGCGYQKMADVFETYFKYSLI